MVLVKKVAKEGGAKWKSMTEEVSVHTLPHDIVIVLSVQCVFWITQCVWQQEKKPYVDKAEELRAEYDKAVKEDNAENEDADVGKDISFFFCCF